MICCHQIGELKRILPLFLLQQDKKACAKIFDTDAVLPADEYDALQDFIGHSHVDVLPWGERIPRHTTKPIINIRILVTYCQGIITEQQLLRQSFASSQ